MDGRHEALLDAELLVDDLDEGREAVGGARRARDDLHRLRVVVVGVDADNDGRGVRVLRRGRDDDLLRAGRDVREARLGRGEGTGRLADVVDADVLPRDLRRVTDAREGDGVAVDDERVAVGADLARAVEAAVDGVVLEEVLEVLRRTRTVDVLELERVAVHRDADDLAANAAEAVDAELDRAGRGHAHGSGRERESHCECLSVDILYRGAGSDLVAHPGFAFSPRLRRSLHSLVYPGPQVRRCQPLALAYKSCGGRAAYLYL